MTKLSGKVAILNEQGDVVEIRDLGPTPVEVKDDYVKTLVENMPPLSEGEQLTEPTYELVKGKITATYGKEEIPPEPPGIEDRLTALEAAVADLRK